ncbi:transposase [Neobacillus pocheonensis]|uniref:Transposase n=1 Tax=Neobacillus pocheonensis TaxID=363869 RepID=A0ABT0WE67_9BACI|nr:transposase [Neobacillus pocheonensis]
MHKNRDFDSTFKLLSLKVIHPDKVKNVVVDMWDPFHKAIRKRPFPTHRLLSISTMSFKKLLKP